MQTTGGVFKIGKVYPNDLDEPHDTFIVVELLLEGLDGDHHRKAGALYIEPQEAIPLADRLAEAADEIAEAVREKGGEA